MSIVNKNSRRQKLKALGLEDACVFPMEDYSSISADCNRYGREWGKKFSMMSNRESGTVTVTRKA